MNARGGGRRGGTSDFGGADAGDMAGGASVRHRFDEAHDRHCEIDEPVFELLGCSHGSIHKSEFIAQNSELRRLGLEGGGIDGEIPELGPAQGMRGGGRAQVALVEQGGESGRGIGGEGVHTYSRAPGQDQIKENVWWKKFGNAGAE